MGDPDPEQIAEATGYFRTYAQVLSEHLAGWDWLVGDGLTVADFAVAVTFPHADEAGIPLASSLSPSAGTTG